MKKLLGAALCAALMFPSGPAGAELFKNLKVNGGLDVQMGSSRNVADFSTNKENQAAGAANNDRLGTALTRVQLGLNWDLLDDVHAKVSLRKNDRTWGTAGGGGQGPANDQMVGAGGIQANTFVQEASVKIDKLFGHVDTTAGRQFYGDPGDLLVYFGPKNTYGLFVTAIDALRADWSNDWVNFSGMAGKTLGAAVAAQAADVDVRGFDVGVKDLPVKANVFVWNRVTHGVGALGTPPLNGTAATGLNDNLWMYGFKLKGEAMGGWAGLTLAANAGQNRLQTASGCTAAGCPAKSANYNGRAMLLDAGYKADVADVAAFTPWLNFGWGTGRKSTLEGHNEDFTAIASDYRPGVIYGRFNTAGALGLGGNLNNAGTFTGYDGALGVATPGLTNRIIWGAGFKATPAAVNKLTAGIAAWDFNYQKATASSILAGPAAMGNRHIGSELDLTFDWAHSENVTLSAGYGHFVPGGFVKETIRAKAGAPGVQEGNSPVNLLFADMSVKF